MKTLGLIVTTALALPLGGCLMDGMGSRCDNGAGYTGSGGSDIYGGSGGYGNYGGFGSSGGHGNTGGAVSVDAGTRDAGPIIGHPVPIDGGGGAGGGGGTGAGAGGATGSGGATGAGGSACIPCGGSPMPVCQFDNQCGVGGRCKNGACEHGCSTAAECGTGQVCTGGLCQTPATSPGQCLYDVDCGAGRTCINGVCHARCTSDASCGAPTTPDRCVDGVCQPDVGPRPQCRADADCPVGFDCVNAVCRTACATDVDCCAATSTSGTFCRQGICVTANEAAPECRMQTDCGAGQACIDAVCE